MRFCLEIGERSTMSGIMPPITSCMKFGCKFHALVSGSTVDSCCPSNAARFFASEVEFLISSPAGPSLSLPRIRASISFSLCVMRPTFFFLLAGPHQGCHLVALLIVVSRVIVQSANAHHSGQAPSSLPFIGGKFNKTNKDRAHSPLVVHTTHY